MYGASQVAQLSGIHMQRQETHVRSLGWEDLLEKGMTTHSSILAWRMPWTEKPGGLQSMGLQSVRHDWVPNTFRWLNSKESTCQVWRSLVQEDPLEEEMVTHPSILAWEIPWTIETYGRPSMGLKTVSHDLTTIATTTANQIILCFTMEKNKARKEKKKFVYLCTLRKGRQTCRFHRDGDIRAEPEGGEGAALMEPRGKNSRNCKEACRAGAGEQGKTGSRVRRKQAALSHSTGRPCLGHWLYIEITQAPLESSERHDKG